MKLADIINVIDLNQKIKVVCKVYGIYAGFTGYKDALIKADEELLNKEVRSMFENDGCLVINLRNE